MMCRGRDLALDVARGLSYLHSNRIAHLDIKSGNVLLTRSANTEHLDLSPFALRVYAVAKSSQLLSWPLTFAAFLPLDFLGRITFCLQSCVRIATHRRPIASFGHKLGA
jgi:serine/threonine protein kinase